MTNIKRIVDFSVYSPSESEREIYSALDILTSERLSCESCPAEDFCCKQRTKRCIESLVAWLNSEVDE